MSEETSGSSRREEAEEAATLEGVSSPGPPPAGAPLMGRRFGNIRLSRLLGRGGMGEVYEGFDETLRRKVAVKAIGADSRLEPAARSRFLREARMLSALDHPNICRIHDYVRGEETDLLVLELIEGESLSRAVRRGLDRSARLRIARQVVAALAAAHKRGVIHRDLKPGNVMVTTDGDAKVLDFGLARSAEELTEAPSGPVDAAAAAPSGEEDETLELAATLHDLAGPMTRRGVAIGTPTYMSPEQARGEPLGPSSDMYSFGLLLQRLWSGRSPYGEDSDQRELLSLAREGKSRPVTGVPRDVASLLDSLKQLDPERRPTAVETAQRLERIATKPQRRLRLALVLAAALVLVFGTLKYVVDLTRERNLAQQARADLQVVADFQARMLRELDLQGMGLRLREDLRRRIGGGTPVSPQDAPVLRLLDGFDTAMMRVNTTDAALRILDEEVLERARRAAAEEFSDRPAIVAELLTSIGGTYYELGLYDKAEEILRASLGVVEGAGGLPERLEYQARSALGTVLGEAGEYDEAVSHLSVAAAGLEQALGADHPETLATRTSLARFLGYMERFEEAEPLFVEALADLERTAGEEDLAYLSAKSAYAWFLNQAGRLDQAEEVQLEVLATKRKVLGEEHLETLTTMNDLGVLYVRSGRYSDAEPLYRKDLETSLSLLGAENHQTLISMTNLGRLYNRMERYEEALPLLEEAVSTSKRVLPEGFFGTGISLQSYGEALVGLGRYDEAEPHLLASHAILEPYLGTGHERLQGLIQLLVTLYEATGDEARAAEWRRRLRP